MDYWGPTTGSHDGNRPVVPAPQLYTSDPHGQAGLPPPNMRPMWQVRRQSGPSFL